MKLIEAVKLIGKEYNITDEGPCYLVHSGLFDRGFEELVIYVVPVNGTAFLTDGADVANGIGDKLSEKELYKIVKMFKFELNDWHIEKIYNNNDDIYRFFELFLYVQTHNE